MWTDWRTDRRTGMTKLTVAFRNFVNVQKTNQLMLYREIITVCSQIHTKHINTVCGQNGELLNAFALSRKAPITVVTSVRLSAALTQRIYVKYYIGDSDGNLSRNSKFGWNRSTIRAIQVQTQVQFIVASEIKWPQIDLFQLNCNRLSGQPRRYEHYANAPQCYVTRTLPVLLLLNMVVNMVTTRLQTVKQKLMVSTGLLTCQNTQRCFGRRIFFLLALQPIAGLYFSPLAGYSLLAYEVSWSNTTTRHSR